MSRLKLIISHSLKSIAIFCLFSSDMPAQVDDHRMDSEPVQCMNDHYRQDLEISFRKRREKIESSLSGRSNNGDFEIHFFIDTSYERRRTGGYNNNIQVETYMANLANQVVSKFNVAAPNWDIKPALKISFFDGATPFSYGNNIVETIENFLDWLIANNFPGDDDVYVFYTGQYTNIGVTYLGTLCWPGVSLMSFVSSQIPNEALSSHEWMGHINDAVHYDSEANIMKSSNATFPWHNSSVADAEDLLEISACVENVQSPLSLEDLPYEMDCTEKGNLNLYFQVDKHQEGSVIRILHSNQGLEWKTMEEILLEPDKKEYLVELNKGKLEKYIRLVQIDGSGHQFQSEVSKVPDCANVQWYVGDGVLYNPENKWIRIYDVAGKMLKQSREPNLILEQVISSGMLVLTDGHRIIRVLQP